MNTDSSSAPRVRRFHLIPPAYSLAVFGAALFSLASCSDPKQAAIDALHEKRYTFSVEDYLLAAAAGDVEAIRLFHEAGQDMNETDLAGDTVLMRACAGGSLELVENLLSAGADPRAVNSKGRTPLMFAAESGRIEVARLLLSRGAEVPAQDKDGWSALKLAAYHGRPEVVELLAGRVDQDTLDQVLLVACFKGSAAVIESLLNHGAYINTRSPENQTPLMISAQNGHLAAVKLLLQHQANPYALDDREKTAANLADAAGHVDVRDLLVDPLAIQEVVENGYSPADAGTDPESAAAEIYATLGALAGEATDAGDSGVPGTTAAAAAGATGASPSAPTATAATTLASGSSVPSRTNSDRRPVAPIVGQTLRPSAATGEGIVESLSIQSYREAPLPVMLKSVEEGAGTAQVRVLSSRDSAPVEVKQGDTIPGTRLKITSMDTKFISSKMGLGKMVDVSRITVEDTESGAKHLLIKDVPGHSSEVYATVALPGSPHDYVVKGGDEFSAVARDGSEIDYEVLEVRPTQVVIRNVATEEVVTVNRQGIAMR